MDNILSVHNFILVFVVFIILHYYFINTTLIEGATEETSCDKARRELSELRKKEQADKEEKEAEREEKIKKCIDEVAKLKNEFPEVENRQKKIQTLQEKIKEDLSKCKINSTNKKAEVAGLKEKWKNVP